VERLACSVRELCKRLRPKPTQVFGSVAGGDDCGGVAAGGAAGGDVAGGCCVLGGDGWPDGAVSFPDIVK
jgi:hypothetical protein